MSQTYIPVALERLVHERANRQCEYCRCLSGFHSDAFAIEHIIPEAKGGTTEEANLALSCLGCNSFKGVFQTGRRLALSIKSNEQISANGLPASFVEDTWEQYLKDTADPFDVHKDYLGLISAPLETEVKNDLSDMQRWANFMEDARFMTEVESKGSGNAVKRSLLQSLQCPASLNSQQTVTKEDVVKLLRRLQFRQFDFLQ